MGKHPSLAQSPDYVITVANLQIGENNVVRLEIHGVKAVALMEQVSFFSDYSPGRRPGIAVTW